MKKEGKKRMIKLIATAESLSQGQALLEAGVDYLVIGESSYGLRLPGYFDREEMAEMIRITHQAGKEVIVAANAILHNDKIDRARDYLSQVKAMDADLLMVGDTGLIQILKEEAYRMPYIYDASVLVTSPGQVNFWAQYGAVGALVAREVPYVELTEMARDAKIPLMVQTYGASCIHQSGRMLLDNYFNFVGKDKTEVAEHELFLSEPKKDETHYSIYEDDHGTHIFANNDLDLMMYLNDLQKAGIQRWYADGIYCPGQAFVEINRLFAQARDAIEAGQWNDAYALQLDQKVRELHPDNRELSTGFFLFDKDTVQ